MFRTDKEADKVYRLNVDRVQQNIKALIKKKGISQEKLAHDIGTDQPYLNYIINQPKSNPSIRYINAIAFELGVELKALFL